MGLGKHTSRYKSFESLEESRKARSRKRLEKEEYEEEKKYNNSDDDSQDYYEDDYEMEDYDDEEDYDDDDEKLLDYRKVAIVIIAIIVVFAIICLIYNLVTGDDKEKVIDEDVSTVDVEDDKMPSNIDGYRVLGQVIISELSVEQYILDSTEDTALKSGVTKIYGPTLNSKGNFCIAGHNYEGIFKDLETLNVGDEIVIKTANNSEYKYKVTIVKNVEPDNLESLLQDQTKVELTLITCQTGSTLRTIVKAELDSNDNG